MRTVTGITSPVAPNLHVERSMDELMRILFEFGYKPETMIGVNAIFTVIDSKLKL